MDMGGGRTRGMGDIGPAGSNFGAAFIGIVEGLEQRRQEQMERERYKETLKLEQDKLKLQEREQELRVQASEVEMQRITEAARLNRVKESVNMLNNYVPMSPEQAAELDPYMPGFFLPDEIAEELGRPSGAAKEYFVPKDVAKEYSMGGRLEKAKKIKDIEKINVELGEIEARAKKQREEVEVSISKRMQEDRKLEGRRVRGMLYQSKMGKLTPSDKALYISMGITTEDPTEFAKELEAIGLGTNADATAKIAYTQFVAGALGINTADAVRFLEKNDEASFVKGLTGALMQNDIRLSNPALEAKEKRAILEGYAESASLLYRNYTSSGRSREKTEGATEKGEKAKENINKHIQEWKNKGKAK